VPKKDLEVGQYYLRKADMDAAIDRFLDAAAAKPGSRFPSAFLAKRQEKKRLKRDAVKILIPAISIFIRMPKTKRRSKRKSRSFEAKYKNQKKRLLKRLLPPDHDTLRCRGNFACGESVEGRHGDQSTQMPTGQKRAKG